MKAIPILVMLTLMLSVGVSSALAVPTEFTLNWSGSGTIGTTFNSGNDAVAQMLAIGNTAGTFYGKDYDDNPYTYSVDTTEAYMRGAITGGGGSLDFKYTRTDSYAPMYGVAGQFSDSYVYSSGTGSLDFKNWSNYAAFASPEYGFQGAANFQATGSSFTIDHYILSGDLTVPKNYGEVYIAGSGSAVVDHMGDDASGVGFNFGAGCGCYTHADITAAGSGIAQVSGHGDNFLQDDGYGNPIVWSMPLGGSYSSTWTYTNGLSVTNYAFNGR